MLGSYEAAYNTTKKLKEVINEESWSNAGEVIHLVKQHGGVMLKEQTENSVGNMVRRILKIIKEEYHSCGKAKTDEQDTQQSLHKLLLADDIEEKYDQNKPELKDSVLTAIDELLSELESCGSEITETPQDYINSGDVIMTLGFSELVQQFIKKAAAKDKKIQVVVAEGAPSCQGRQLAENLSKSGIQTSLIPDSAVFAVMSRCNKVILPTKAVMADGGLKAQTGAYTVALAAKHYSIPVMVLAPVYKLTPEYLKWRDPDAFNEFGSPDQILAYDSGEIIEHVHITNPLFDFVPANLVTVYVTNIGGYSPPYIYRLLADLYHHDDYELDTSSRGRIISPPSKQNLIT